MTHYFVVVHDPSARAHVASSGTTHSDTIALEREAPAPLISLRLALAAVIGLAAGALTEWMVPHLSFTFEPLSNSAAPWILVAFAMALTARRTGESLILAVVTLLALVVGFYATQAHHGWAVSRHQVEFWSAASVAIGPLIGLAAGWLRYAGRTAAAVGAGILGGLLVGEAIHGLVDLKYSTSPNYWWVQLALGVGLAIGLVVWRSRRHLLSTVPALAASFTTGALVTLVTVIVYQAP